MKNLLFLHLEAENLPDKLSTINTFNPNAGEGSGSLAVPANGSSVLDNWPTLKRQMMAVEGLVVFNRQELQLLDKLLTREGLAIKPLNYYCLQDKVVKMADLDSYDFEAVCHHFAVPEVDYLTRLAALYEKIARQTPFVGLDLSVKFFTLDRLQGSYDQFFAGVLELEKLLANIRCDGQVQAREFSQLQAWRDQHEEQRFALGYAPIIAILDNVLADNVLTIDECDDILDWLAHHHGEDSGDFTIWFSLLAPVAPPELITGCEPAALKSWCQNNCWSPLQEQQVKEAITMLVMENKISSCQGRELLATLASWAHHQSGDSTLQNKLCVLTGSFYASRQEVEERLQRAGAIIAPTVDCRTDLLIVGGDIGLGGDKNRGRQIKKARELQAQGRPIEILGERQLWPVKPLSAWRRYGQNFIMVLILLNLLMAMLETSPAIEARWGAFFYIFNLVSAAIFIVEMVVRIVLDGKKFWVGRRAAWNYFDLLITIATSISCSGAISSFRLLRMMRIIRSLRALRLVSGLKNLRHIIGALLRSLPKIGWTLLLMLMVFVIWATVGTNLFGGPTGAEPFANIGRSLFTLVQLMTFDDLGNIAIPIISQNVWAVLYFLSFIFVISFVMLNVVTGVIVDSIATSKEEEDDDGAIG